MIDPPPASAGRGCAVSELDGVGSRLGGSIIRGCDALQNAQDLLSVATLAEQGEGKVQGHGRMLVWFGVGVFQGAPVPMGQAAISRSSSQRANSRTSSWMQGAGSCAFMIAARH